MSLERFGIRWNGPHEPMATPMDDGYWTPWHIAEAEIAALRQEIATGRGQYHRDYAAECDALLAAKDKVIADLRQERSEQDSLRSKLDAILTATANALKGDPPEDTLHSWHDLADVARALRERCERLVALERARRDREDVLKSQPDDWQVLAELAQIEANAKLAVNAHNDLAPAAGEAQEKTDG